ncbi:hypothetical protein AAGS61_01565 [Lysinibacillus sp. KU-BSD001]|uniref:hypothetical protein n=1 Tax=Lysinibacillus sp. KU-BSD001 TaxID=3141328 RepID=UPI0036EA3705
MDVARELESIIAIYFNGDSYSYNGVELSREDSKIIAYYLINTLQLIELIMAKERKK